VKRITARLIGAAALAAILLSAAPGCSRECPTEPAYDDLLVGTWHDSSTGWTTTFGADGSYRARLYTFFYDVTNVGEYRVSGDRFEVWYTQFADGARQEGYLDAVIVTLTDNTLVFDYNDNGYYGRSRNRRVS
jgi:hypothetical protein